MNTELRTSLTHLFNAPLFTVGRTPVTLTTLIVFVGAVVLTMFLARLAERGTRRGFELRGVTDRGTTGAAARLVQYAVMLLVEDRLVRVTHMGLRATVARTRDEEDLIIPQPTDTPPARS